MRKVRLTESDLVRIIEKVVKEELGGMDDSHPVYGNMNLMKDLDMEKVSKKSDKSFEEDKKDLISTMVSYDDFMRFCKEQPELAKEYFSIGGDSETEDDFEIEDSDLTEMKRKVRVMENKLRRRKQMRGR
jgi:hypothetical protein